MFNQGNQGIPINNQNPGYMQSNVNDVWVKQVASLAAQAVIESMTKINQPAQQNFINPVVDSGPSHLNNAVWNTDQQNYYKETPYDEQGFNNPVQQNFTNPDPGNFNNPAWNMEQQDYYEENPYNEQGFNNTDQQNFRNPGPSHFNNPAWETDQQDFYKEKDRQSFKFRDNTKSNRFIPYPKENFSNSNLDPKYSPMNVAINQFVKGIIQFHYVKQNRLVPRASFISKLKETLKRKLIAICSDSASGQQIYDKYNKYIRRDEVNILKEVNDELEGYINKNYSQTKDATCSNCGKKGHTASECYCQKIENVVCYRCRKTGHLATKCTSGEAAGPSGGAAARSRSVGSSGGAAASSRSVGPSGSAAASSRSVGSSGSAAASSRSVAPRSPGSINNGVNLAQKCTTCGKKGHTAATCKCFRCGRTGHLARNCTSEIAKPSGSSSSATPRSRTHSINKSGSPALQCTNCDKKGHTTSECYSKGKKNITCYHCGKTGHYFNKCPSVEVVVPSGGDAASASSVAPNNEDKVTSETDATGSLDALIDLAVEGFMKSIIRGHYVNQKKDVPTIPFQEKLKDIITKRMRTLCTPDIPDLKGIRQVYYKHIRTNEKAILAETKAELIEDKLVHKYLDRENRVEASEDEDEEMKELERAIMEGNTTVKAEAHEFMDLMTTLLNKGQEAMESEPADDTVQPDMAEVDQVLSDAIENRLHDVQINFNLKLTSFPVLPAMDEIKELLKHFKVTAMEKTDTSYVINCDAYRTFDTLLAANVTEDEVKMERATPLPEEFSPQMDEDLDSKSKEDTVDENVEITVKKEKPTDITKEIQELLAENDNGIGDDW